MVPLTSLISSFIISFGGSLPPGAINLFVIQNGKSAGWQSAFIWAFLAAAIESLHVGLALWIHFQWMAIPEIKIWAYPTAGFILVGMGLYLLVKQSNTKPIVSLKAFVGIAFFNPMAIPFWLGALQLVQPEAESLFAILIGSFFGAWVCLALFGGLGFGLQSVQFISQNWINQALGWTLICLAGWQFFRFYNLYFQSSTSILSFQTLYSL